MPKLKKNPSEIKYSVIYLSSHARVLRDIGKSNPVMSGLSIEMKVKNVCFVKAS